LELTSKKVLCFFTLIDVTRGKLVRASKIAVGMINLRIVANTHIITSTKEWSITRGTADCSVLLTLLDVGNKWSKVVFVT
jgi:hypothetical protein